MKKFDFPLQKLLGYKEQVFDTELRILTEMRGALQRMERELRTLEAEHHRRADEFNRMAAQGTTAQDMELHKMYMTIVDNNIEQKKQQIYFQRQAIDQQTDKVREAKIELGTLEKLKEKKLEEYTYLEGKANEQFIEEFVSNTRAAALIESESVGA